MKNADIGLKHPIDEVDLIVFQAERNLWLLASVISGELLMQIMERRLIDARGQFADFHLRSLSLHRILSQQVR